MFALKGRDMAYRFRSMNLKTRVLLVVTVIVFAGIWFFAAHMSAVLQADIEKLVAQQLSTQVDYVAAELDEELQLRIDSLKAIAASIKLGVPADAAKVQRLLDAQKPSLILFPLGIIITNKDGTIIADHSSNPERHRAGFFGDRHFFREVMANGKSVIGRPEVGRFSGQPVIPIAVPLFDADGVVAGVLHAPVRNSDPDLFGKLREARVGESGKFRLMSPRDGVIVAATDASEIMKPLTPKGENKMTDRRLYEGFEAAAVTVTPSGVEVLGASRKLRTAGWVLFGNITTAEAFAPIRKFNNHVYIAALLISLSLAVILYFFLRRQLVPLENARMAMQRMTAGVEPFGAIPVSQDDEIGGLVASFDRLVAERQRIDAELAHASYRNEMLLRTASDGIHVLDAEGNVLQVSDAFCSMLGYSRDELSGMNVSQWDAQWSAQEVQQLIERLKQVTAAPTIIETKHKHRDGSIINVEISSTGVEIDGKQVLYCSARDITKRKQMEAEIRALNEDLERRVAERTSELKKSQQELQALTAVQDSIQDEERKRIARELHDELAQKLTVLKLQLQALASKIPPHDRGLSRQLDDMNLLLTDTMRAVRQIAANLRSVVLDELGLVTALRGLADEFSQQAGIDCEFSVHPADLAVDDRIANPLYRMVQESLTNVARHARATEVVVSLYRDPAGTIVLNVDDNGKGMSNDGQPTRKSFGLIGMRERATMLGGEMKIRSEPGAGTSIEIVIPLSPAQPGSSRI
jgi:PAS domain S-box-containing protein